MRFFLGSHRPHWLADPNIAVPLFISDRQLRGYKRLPRAIAPWCLDSGGFTELQKYGSWAFGPSPAEYVDRIRRYAEEIGQLVWAAPQDLMCEPAIRLGGVCDGQQFAGTGLSVRRHQQLTVENFCTLRALAPDLPIIPVLQGWSARDYVHCLTLYARNGVDLSAEMTVGIGSVCRRQATAQVGEIIAEIAAAVPGIRLHGFGTKVGGLKRYGGLLYSADSLAWSFGFRRADPLPGCTHKRCTNCPRAALRWRAKVLSSLSTESGVQLGLFTSAGEPAPTITTEGGRQGAAAQRVGASVGPQATQLSLFDAA